LDGARARVRRGGDLRGDVSLIVRVVDDLEVGNRLQV
jgi:hypothetical protein